MIKKNTVMTVLKSFLCLSFAAMTLSACTPYMGPVGGPWVAGHFNGMGRWVPGHYANGPAYRAGWMPGHYNRFGQWIPGHWR